MKRTEIFREAAVLIPAVTEWLSIEAFFAVCDTLLLLLELLSKSGDVNPVIAIAI